MVPLPPAVRQEQMQRLISQEREFHNREMGAASFPSSWTAHMYSAVMRRTSSPAQQNAGDNGAAAEHFSSPPQSAGSPAAWQDHTGNGWVARPAAPPADESMLIPLELYHAHFAGWINQVVTDAVRAQLTQMNDAVKVLVSARANIKPLVQILAADVLDQQLDRAAKPALAMGILVHVLEEGAEDGSADEDGDSDDQDDAKTDNEDTSESWEDDDEDDESDDENDNKESDEDDDED